MVYRVIPRRTHTTRREEPHRNISVGELGKIGRLRLSIPIKPSVKIFCSHDPTIISETEARRTKEPHMYVQLSSSKGRRGLRYARNA